jgi:nucleotidyltransferase substrate binding protein (TIGR01987 family)
MQALTEAKQKYENPENADSITKRIYLTAFIKDFELTNELLWKFLKLLIEEHYEIKTIGSKDTIKAAQEALMIDQQTASILLDMIKDRNTAVHIYDEQEAERLCMRIIETYYPTIEKLIGKLKKLSTITR